MTKILTTVALLATIATPAFAANTQNSSNAYAWAQSQSKYGAALNGGGSEGYNRSEAQSVINR